jgi:hypothetical protein
VPSRTVLAFQRSDAGRLPRQRKPFCKEAACPIFVESLPRLTSQDLRTRFSQSRLGTPFTGIAIGTVWCESSQLLRQSTTRAHAAGSRSCNRRTSWFPKERRRGRDNRQNAHSDRFRKKEPSAYLQIYPQKVPRPAQRLHCYWTDPNFAADGVTLRRPGAVRDLPDFEQGPD